MHYYVNWLATSRIHITLSEIVCLQRRLWITGSHQERDLVVTHWLALYIFVANIPQTFVQFRLIIIIIKCWVYKHVMRTMCLIMSMMYICMTIIISG